MTTTKCAVQACNDSPTDIFTVLAGGDGIPLQWAVCTFHSRALNAGEAYALTDDQAAILLGGETPLKALNFEIKTDGLSAPVITLILGHDDIESQRVDFEVQPDMLRELCHFATGSKHEEVSAV